MIGKKQSAESLTPNIFIRFLVGYNWRLEEAEHNFLEFFDFYTKKMAGRRPEDFPELEKLQPLQWLGNTAGGLAVALLRMSRVRYRPDNDDCVVHMCLCIWRVLEYTDPRVDKYVIFTDITDYGKSGIGVEAAKRLNAMVSYKFPDVMAKNVIFPFGFITTKLFGVVSMFLHEVTRSKISVLGGDKDAITKAFLEQLPADKVPREYGGARREG